MPNNRHLQKILIFLFHSKKNAAEGNRDLQKIYGDAALSEKMCHSWFCRFKHGDFDVEDRLVKEGETSEDAELEALLGEDLCHPQNELVSALGVTFQGI